MQTVEWDMLLFFAAMFVMIEASAEVGMIGMIGGWLESAIRATPEGSRLIVAIQILLWASAVISGVLDNIPYTITMGGYACLACPCLLLAVLPALSFLALPLPCLPARPLASWERGWLGGSDSLGSCWMCSDDALVSLLLCLLSRCCCSARHRVPGSRWPWSGPGGELGSCTSASAGQQQQQ